ncbi:MAG TPA: M23 family metallopeptidase [Smithellaceae bacterium]|nr:M23 family metallopeptidase [Smithellaceae bacterium]
MKSFIRICACLIMLFNLSGCHGSTPDTRDLRFTVIAQDMPYPTDRYIRIGYTLKMWEYEKEGLDLRQIDVLDGSTRATLYTIEKKDIPKIYKDPLPANPYYPTDKLDHYYISLQIPFALGRPVPKSVTHRFHFQDQRKNRELSLEGGTFSPDPAMTSIIIASPVRGKNWLFVNQSTMGYHFNAMFFALGKRGTGERFAFDNLQFDDDLKEYFHGDPAKNESYFNYSKPLYAVADGKVVAMRDGLPENSGNDHSVTFKEPVDLAGNYIIIDIGNGHYAFYAHCRTNSIKVKVGDRVKEGDEIALLGNSGNSDAPHLHFQICDAPDFFFSRGLPFVLKKYTKIAESGQDVLPPPKDYVNAMMEELTVIGFE